MTSLENTPIKSVRGFRDKDVTKRRSPTGWRIDLRFPTRHFIILELNWQCFLNEDTPAKPEELQFEASDIH